MRPSVDERPGTPELIDRWAADGVITPAQAARMRRDVAPDTRQRTSFVVEALAYLGGVIVLVAAGLIAAQYWHSLPETAQLGLVGGAALVMLLAGRAVPKPLSPVSERLRSVLWLLSTAGAAAFVALFADRVLELEGAAITVTAGCGAAVLAAALWWRLRVLPQQAAFFASLMIAAGATIAQLTSNSHLPGLGVWGVAVAWFALGQRGTVTPRRPVLALGATAALVGSIMTLPADAGIVLALSTVVGIVVMAVIVRDLWLLAVGAVGALNILPAVMNEWFPGQLAAPLVLLAVGGVLVTAAVYTAKVRGKS